MRRRSFIALATAGVASPGVFADESPVFTAGLMTDTHVTPDPASFDRVKKAYAFFKANKVDLIVNNGDIADCFAPEAYRLYREVRESTYPDRATAPKEIYCWAWHDNHKWTGEDGPLHLEAFKDVKRLLGITHEAFDGFEFAGFKFLVMPQWHDARYERMVSEACAATPNKPVFIFDHVPPSNTVYHSRNWGNDATRKVLDRHPNAVTISGHIHGSLHNEAFIWQGNFTCVNLGGLNYFDGEETGEHEANGQSYGVVIMKLFPNRVEFHRHSLVDGSEIAPDRVWTLVWPFNPATAPYAPARRMKTLRTPQFAEDAEVKADAAEIAKRGLVVDYPAVDDLSSLFYYRVKLLHRVESGWDVVTERERRSDYWRETEAPRNGKRDFFDPAYFAAGGKYRLVVEPVGFWRNAGYRITRDFTLPAGVGGKSLWKGIPESFENGGTRSVGGWSDNKTVVPYAFAAPAKNLKLLLRVKAENSSEARMSFSATVDGKGRGRGAILASGVGFRTYVLNVGEVPAGARLGISINYGHCAAVTFESVELLAFGS